MSHNNNNHNNRLANDFYGLSALINYMSIIITEVNSVLDLGLTEVFCVEMNFLLYIPMWYKIFKVFPSFLPPPPILHIFLIDHTIGNYHGVLFTKRK